MGATIRVGVFPAEAGIQCAILGSWKGVHFLNVQRATALDFPRSRESVP